MTVPSGILLVDKPQGLTSHDVVARARRALGTRKVGHAGTLDPMATGLLVLGVGSSTRLLHHLVGADKEYLATIRLGQVTTTDDADGDVVETATSGAAAALDSDAVTSGIAALTGDILQVPSAVSAIKVGGERAYARVRAGESVVLAARPVTVGAFELLGRREIDGLLDLDVRVACSSGTYVRALARDLGSRLGVGGHLTALRRTRVGPFSVADAAPLEGLDASRLLSPAAAAAAVFPVLALTAPQAVDLGHGKRVDLGATAVADSGLRAAVGPDGRLVALVEVRAGTARVVTGFPPDEPGSSGPSSGSEREAER